MCSPTVVHLQLPCRALWWEKRYKRGHKKRAAGCIQANWHNSMYILDWGMLLMCGTEGAPHSLVWSKEHNAEARTSMYITISSTTIGHWDEHCPLGCKHRRTEPRPLKRLLFCSEIKQHSKHSVLASTWLSTASSWYLHGLGRWQVTCCTVGICNSLYNCTLCWFPLSLFLL